jgi:hypothetical protein
MAGLLIKSLTGNLQMTKVLNFIERNIVIALLAEEHIVLNLLLYPKDAEPIIIPVETGFAGVEVSTQGILTIKQPFPKLDFFIDKEIIVVLDFRKLGLSFIAPLTKAVSGFEILIPAKITRLLEKVPKTGLPVSAQFDFAIPEKTNMSNLCITSESFSPLSLIFINDKILTLGGLAQSFPFEKTKEYALQITCRTGQLNRSIYATYYVAEIYSVAESKKQCAICVFTNIKAEDRRFLFEKR